MQLATSDQRQDKTRGQQVRLMHLATQVLRSFLRWYVRCQYVCEVGSGTIIDVLHQAGLNATGNVRSSTRQQSGSAGSLDASSNPSVALIPPLVCEMSICI